MSPSDAVREQARRLLAALDNNPEVKYLVWSWMQQVKYYRPWLPNPSTPGGFMLTDPEGNDVIASTEPLWNCFGWSVTDGNGGEAFTEAEARAKVMGALAIDGRYFPLPDSEK